MDGRSELGVGGLREKIAEKADIVLLAFHGACVKAARSERDLQLQ